MSDMDACYGFLHEANKTELNLCGDFSYLGDIGLYLVTPLENNGNRLTL
jgi:hypothetical protein